MKTVTYDIEIDSISSVFGRYPGEVDVSIHREGGDLGLRRDGFETVRVPLSEETILPDGSRDEATFRRKFAITSAKPKLS